MPRDDWTEEENYVNYCSSQRRVEQWVERTHREIVAAVTAGASGSGSGSGSEVQGSTSQAAQEPATVGSLSLLPPSPPATLLALGIPFPADTTIASRTVSKDTEASNLTEVPTAAPATAGIAAASHPPPILPTPPHSPHIQQVPQSGSGLIKSAKSHPNLGDRDKLLRSVGSRGDKMEKERHRSRHATTTEEEREDDRHREHKSKYRIRESTDSADAALARKSRSASDLRRKPSRASGLRDRDRERSGGRRDDAPGIDLSPYLPLSYGLIPLLLAATQVSAATATTTMAAALILVTGYFAVDGSVRLFFRKIYQAVRSDSFHSYSFSMNLDGILRVDGRIQDDRALLQAYILCGWISLHFGCAFSGTLCPISRCIAIRCYFDIAVKCHSCFGKLRDDNVAACLQSPNVSGPLYK